MCGGPPRAEKQLGSVGLVHREVIGEVVVCGKVRGVGPAVMAVTGRRAPPRCGALIRAAPR